MKDYSIINEEVLSKQQEQNKKQQDIRIIFEVKFISNPGNCQKGAIDNCRNASWCAQCVDPTRAKENPCKKVIVGEQIYIPNM